MHDLHLENLKLAATSMEESVEYSNVPDQHLLLIDSTKYRQVIGSLQYLTNTRLYISFLVNKMAQYIMKLTVTHWSSQKTILRYLSYNPFVVIHILKTSKFNLASFFDGKIDKVMTDTLSFLEKI